MSYSKASPSKAEEAVSEDSINISENVPAYGQHATDDVYTDFNESYQTGLPTIDDSVEGLNSESIIGPHSEPPEHPLSLATSAALPRNEVPSYGNHTTDQLYTESNPSYQTGLPTLEGSLESSNSETVFQSAAASPVSQPRPTPAERVSSPLPPPASSGPISLTLDKALIFPNTVPATALYSLNYTLNSMGSSVTLRRSVPGPVRTNGKQGKIVDKDLYDIKRPPLNFVTFHLHGKRKSTYPGVGQLQMKLGLRGRYWECKFKEKVVLKGRNGVWNDGEGKLVAREVNEVVAKRGKGKEKQVVVDDGVRENPGLIFEERADGEANDLLTDLMVAVWCAKTWCAETWEAKSATPSASEGSYSYGPCIKERALYVWKNTRGKLLTLSPVAKHLRTGQTMAGSSQMWISNRY